MAKKKKDEPVLQDWRWDVRGDGTFWYHLPEELAQRNALARHHNEQRLENSLAADTGDITEGGKYRDLVKLMGGD
jgi:hypothetical protein